MAMRAGVPTIDRPETRRVPERLSRLSPDRRIVAWWIISAPWWVWSDIPRLPWPSRDPVAPEGGLAGDWVVRGLDRIARRIWVQRMLAIVVRGIALALAIGSGWLAVELLGGPAFERRIWFGFGLALMLCSVIIGAFSRPARAQVARMLDRSFGLQERISTALGNIGRDLPAEGEAPSIAYLQVADAANAITLSQAHPAFRVRPPVREVVLAIALGLLFVALAFARGTGDGVPDVQANAVPIFVPAAQRFVQPAAPVSSDAQAAPSGSDTQQSVQTSLDNQHDLQALADALADHAVTRDVAQAIRQGDYSRAAETLRAVSTQADQLSENARQELASDLNQAAERMSEGNQALSEATRQAAAGLQDGGDPARTGMRNLANVIEQRGQHVQSPGAIEQAVPQSQESSSSAPGSSQQPASSPSQASTGQPGSEDQSGSPSESGEQAGQPGENASTSGADANAGIGSDPDSTSGQPGTGGPATTDAAGAPGRSSESGQGKPSDQNGSASGQSQPGAQTGATSDASQGSGAGSNSGQLDAQGIADADTGAAAPNESAGRASSNPQISEAEPPAGSGASALGSGEHEAVELSRAPQGESVRIGGSSSAASLGSGAGVTVSSGATRQGEVGANGPDSNHVPADYRAIVEGYFSDKDGGQ